MGKKGGSEALHEFHSCPQVGMSLDIPVEYGKGNLLEAYLGKIKRLDL